LTILYYSPSNSVGGAELSLLHTMQYMKTNGIRIVMAMPPAKDSSYFLMAKKVANAIYLVKGMNWISSKEKGIAKIKNWAYNAYKSGGWHITPVLKLVKIILQEKVDLIHTNSTVCIDAAFAAKITRRPHIQHIREITGTKEEALFKLKFQGTLFFRRLYANLNHTILCNSFYTLKQSEVDFPKEKLKVIYNSIKLPEKLPESFQGGVMQVCTMANITARMKNHLLVLQVAKCLKDTGNEANFKFKLYGILPPESDPYLAGLRSFIDQHQLQNMVEFKGLDLTSDILNNNHVLFHTFAGESFGRVYIEAMSYGRPVIAVKGGGATELIEDGKEGYLVNHQHPENIAQSLMNMANNKKKYEVFRQNCILKAKTFSEDVIFPELLKTYKNIININ
jgi:glycosyltransferase involved in cell wall biosynthesis